MPEFLPPDWTQVFRFETPILELVARGSLMYFAILALLRLMPRRSGGELARMDLVFLLLIAEAATHALGGYSSVTDALIVILTLMAWDYLINALSFRFPFVERLISARAVPIVRDGRILMRNMRREYITEDELMGALRRDGVDDLARVKAAFVEGEGRISVVTRSS